MTPIQHAVILAAGRGSRLKNLTDKSPKPLLNINGKSLLERQIIWLKKQGVEFLTIVIGYEGHQIIKAVEDKSKIENSLTVKFITNDNWAQSNTATSLYHALCTNENHPCYVLDGDLIFNNMFNSSALSLDCDGLMVCDTDLSKLDDEAMKVMANRNRIVGLGKSLLLSESQGEFIGLSLWNVSLIKKYCHTYSATRHQNLYYEDVIKELLDNKQIDSIQMTPIPSECWVEIDDSIDLNRALKIKNLD